MAYSKLTSVTNMQLKECAPYTHQKYSSFRHIRYKYKHIHNAPYVLTKYKDIIHLYEINKAKHHSLKKEDNEMTINESNDAWEFISAVNIQPYGWGDIDVILYSQIDHLLWFVFDHTFIFDQPYYYKILGYSIQDTESV